MDLNYLINVKISNELVPNYDMVENSFLDEKLTEIIESERLKVDLQYPKLNFKNAVNKAYIRTGTYKRLLKALEILPKEYGFKILDVWRPLALQKELYEKYSNKIIRDFNLDKLTEIEKRDFISKFISEPIDDKNYPPAHTSGGAVDLILIDSNENELDLGVKFDEFTKRSYTDYYEKNDENEEIKYNRRILYNSMTLAGFTNLPSEVWHYDFGNKNWAYYTNKKSLYNGIFSKEEVDN